MVKSAMSWSWVFQGEKSTFPSAVFSDQETAEVWIAKSKVSGILTGYPLDECVYDWAIEAGHFNPNTEKKRTPEFIQKFTSAFLPHAHYQNGIRTAGSPAISGVALGEVED